jgi:hypothetical protein
LDQIRDTQINFSDQFSGIETIHRMLNCANDMVRICVSLSLPTPLDALVNLSDLPEVE